MKCKILVVDDEKDMLALLTRIITEKTEHEVVGEHNPLRAVDLIEAEPFDMVITDLKMPKMDGIVLLDHVRRTQPSAAVIMMTAYGTIETAVEATRKGALDYITKPFRKERLLLTIRRALDWQALKRENVALRRSIAQQQGFPSIIGSSPAIKTVLDQIKQVAKSMATILMIPTGPTAWTLVF